MHFPLGLNVPKRSDDLSFGKRYQPDYARRLDIFYPRLMLAVTHC